MFFSAFPSTIRVVANFYCLILNICLMKTSNVYVKTRLGYWAKMIYELLTPKQKWLQTINLRGKKLYLFDYACRRLPNS